MSERVNHTTFINTALANIQLSTARMQKYQEQISTGKKINRPSDDPAGARAVLDLRAEGLRLDQYTSNIQNAKNSVEFTTTVLRQIADLMTRAQELTVQGVNGTADQSVRDAVASEINGILESLLQSANSKLSGKYIFTGTETTTTPFTATRNSAGQISAITYNGNREKIEYLVGPNMKVQVNQPGEEAFIDNKLFDALINVRDSLKSGAVTFARAELDNIENGISSVANMVSRMGGVASTLELLDNRVEDTKLSVAEVLGEKEGADLAELILRLQEEENILQATLASAAFIFRTSILDYL